MFVVLGHTGHHGSPPAELSHAAYGVDLCYLGSLGVGMKMPCCCFKLFPPLHNCQDDINLGPMENDETFCHHYFLMAVGLMGCCQSNV